MAVQEPREESTLDGSMPAKGCDNLTTLSTLYSIAQPVHVNASSNKSLAYGFGFPPPPHPLSRDSSVHRGAREDGSL